MICENCKERPASVIITKESMVDPSNIIYVRSALSNHKHSILILIKNRCRFNNFYRIGSAEQNHFKNNSRQDGKSIDRT